MYLIYFFIVGLLSACVVNTYRHSYRYDQKFPNPDKLNKHETRDYRGCKPGECW